MKKDWSFLTNPFLALAKRSRPKAIEAADYTNDQLKARQADPFYLDLFTFFDPLNQAMQNEESALNVQIAAQKGSTATVGDLLDTLSAEKIESWDIAIQVVYRKGTPQYIALLPQGRGPFQSGKKDDRITAVKSLGIALTGIVALATTKTDVDNFFTSINNARSAQSGKIGNTETDSGDLTDAVISGMEGMFYVLTACLAKFYIAPKTVEPLFALNLIRDSEQDSFIRTLTGGSYDFVAKRTLEPTTKLRVKVLTPKKVRIFIADEKNDINPAKFKEIEGLEEEVFEAAVCGTVPEAKFIKAQNMDDLLDAKIEIELL
jgi:hypothetical protein